MLDTWLPSECPSRLLGVTVASDAGIANNVAMTPSVGWQRQHGEELRVHVWQSAPREFSIAVFHRSTSIREVRRVTGSADSAKAAADALVRREFDHRCSMESCSDWMPWIAPTE